MPHFQKVPLFHAHDTIDEAFSAVDTIAGSFHKSDRVGVYTAVYTLYNTTATLANAKIESLETEIAMLKKAYYELQYKGQ